MGRVTSRIDVMRPWLGEEEAAAVADVIASGFVDQGPRVAGFEDAFAGVQQAQHAVAVSNGTTALHLALKVAGIGAYDDVVVPSYSFIATANAVTYVGARPVFADVEPDSGNVSVRTLAAALTPATRAVIAVDQGGMPVDLHSIRALCDGLGITVIEDAACAAGSTYRGRPVGADAELTVWSFHPGQILTTGEGGMLTTDNAAWADRARTLRDHAASAPADSPHALAVAPAEEYGEIGFNYRMTDLQAAIGLVQLDRLSEAVSRRRAIADAYRKALDCVAGLRVSEDPLHGTSNVQSFWVEVMAGFAVGREELLRRLALDGITAGRGVVAAHRQAAYAGLDTGKADLSITERLTDNTVVLPVYHQLSLVDQSRVIDAMLNAAGPLPVAVR